MYVCLCVQCSDPTTSQLLLIYYVLQYRSVLISNTKQLGLMNLSACTTYPALLRKTCDVTRRALYVTAPSYGDVVR